MPLYVLFRANWAFLGFPGYWVLEKNGFWSHTECVRSKKEKKNCNSLSEVDALLHMVAGLRRLVGVDVDQVDLDKIGIVHLVSLFMIGFHCLCGCG